jgi:hypothetical protein
MIRPGYAGTSYFSAERGGVTFGYDVYLGIQGRLLAQNISSMETPSSIAEASIKKSPWATP